MLFRSTGFNGQISLGHGAFMGIGAYVPALLWNYQGLTPWIGIPLGVALAVLLALGPLFIVLTLFESTRKFFDAWLRQLLRVVLLLLLCTVALQLVFAARIALMGFIDPQSTTFQRSEAWRLLEENFARVLAEPHDLELSAQDVAAVTEKEVMFDARKFSWIGSLAVVQDVISVWHTAPAKTIDEAVELFARSTDLPELRHQGRPAVGGFAQCAPHVHAHHVRRAFPHAVERRLAIEPRHRAFLDAGRGRYPSRPELCQSAGYPAADSLAYHHCSDQ